MRIAIQRGFRRLALQGVLAVCLLAGCSSAPVQPTRWSLAAGERATAAASHLPSGMQMHVTAAPWINQTGFLYSLNYKTGKTFESYADNQWVDRPPVLIEDLMRLAYASGHTRQTNAIRVSTHEPVRASTLNVRLVEFAQHYRSANESEARIAAVATVTDLNSDQTRSAVFHASAPAPSADASGGALALTEASDQLIEQVFNWAAGR